MNHLKLFETGTESFIVKIWTEEANDVTQWHGQITHVLSGQDHLFYSLDDIEAFILPYLQHAHTNPASLLAH